MIGKTISHYQVIEKIGEGAMGEVYLAFDTELRRKAALKFISAQYNSDPEFKTRFKREAQAAAALNHPNIITIYNFGEFEDRSYIAMEYLEGGSLKELIAARSLGVEEAIRLATQICTGLSKAHEQGTVHRDIKPANILLTKTGEIKIVDFGLALLQGGTGITRTGTTMGTPHYMSPEQARGEKLDLRSDVFSVGVVLYELLTGELPFKGDNLMIVLYAIVNQEAPPLQTFRPGISPGLQKIIDRALSKDIKVRYRRMEEFLFDLEKEKARLPLLEQPTTTILVENAPPPPAKSVLKQRLWQSGAAAALAVALIWGIWQLRAGKAPPFFASARVTTLAISTAPMGAAVFLNNDSVGVTPLNLKRAAPGQFVLRLRKTDYFAIDTAISIVRGQPAAFNFSLQPAASFVLTVKPSEAQVMIDGKATPASQWPQVQLAPGEHDLVISAPGYQTKQEQLHLRQGRNPAREYRLETASASVPLPAGTMGAISIVSMPAGASVFLDDRPAGKTPFEDQAMAPGAYQVLLRLEEHEEFSTSAVIRPGAATAVRATLNPVGTLDLDSEPKGAAIFLDGRDLGKTPLKTQVRAGARSVVMRAPGYKDFSITINVEKGQTAAVAGRLEAWIGRLSVVVKPYGSIYINDKLEIRDSRFRYSKDLAAMKYRLRAVHPVLGTWEKEVMVEPDKENFVEIDLNTQVTITVIAFDEAGARLYPNIFVDGKNTNQTTPRQLKLPIGLHKIEVRLEGFQVLEGARTILLETDWDEPLRFTLKRNP